MIELVGALVDRLVAAGDILTLAAAFFLVAWLAERHARDVGLEPAEVASASTWLVLGTVAGARLGYVLPNYPTYLRHPLDLIYVQSGLSVWGAMAGALAAALWLRHRLDLPPGRLADLFAPYLALGVAVYDALCLVRGACSGVVAPFPFGVVLPGSSQPRIPTDVWEAALMLGLSWLLLDRRKRRSFDGEVGLLFVIGFSAIRAATDLLRLNLGSWPTPDQALALVAIVLAGMVWAWQRRSVPRPKVG